MYQSILMYYFHLIFFFQNIHVINNIEPINQKGFNIQNNVEDNEIIFE